MNRPTTPKPINPPITPAIRSSSGKSTPRRIRTGFSTLSITRDEHGADRERHAPTRVPVQNSQITAGSRTGSGPSCATQSTNVIASSTPARGTPLTQRPTPRDQRLHERGDDDAERDAARRLRGEPHGLLAAVAADAARELHDAVRRDLALRVENRGEHDRQQ